MNEKDCITDRWEINYLLFLPDGVVVYFQLYMYAYFLLYKLIIGVI